MERHLVSIRSRSPYEDGPHDLESAIDDRRADARCNTVRYEGLQRCVMNPMDIQMSDVRQQHPYVPSGDLGSSFALERT